MNRKEILEMIFNDCDFIDSLEIPYKSDFLECAYEDSESCEAQDLIDLWECR